MELKTIEQARAFAARNRIACERDWDSQTWFNRWNVYRGFTAQLAGEVSPSSDDWRPAVKALAAALHV